MAAQDGAQSWGVVGRLGREGAVCQGESVPQQWEGILFQGPCRVAALTLLCPLPVLSTLPTKCLATTYLF